MDRVIETISNNKTMHQMCFVCSSLKMTVPLGKLPSTGSVVSSAVPSGYTVSSGWPYSERKAYFSSCASPLYFPVPSANAWLAVPFACGETRMGFPDTVFPDTEPPAAERDDSAKPEAPTAVPHPAGSREAL